MCSARAAWHGHALLLEPRCFVGQLGSASCPCSVICILAEDICSRDKARMEAHLSSKSGVKSSRAALLPTSCSACCHHFKLLSS